eukprot:m.327763 g.327763  ORF g.327763 m.327763 type:complete len:496 (+) comp19749_c0_seq2:132-1619(+)
MDTAKAPEERVVTETSTATEGEAEAEAVPAEADAATTEAPTAPADDVDGGDEGMVAERLQTAIQGVLENDINGTDFLTHLSRVRRCLSRDRDPPIDAVLESGALPIMVRCLREHVQATTLFEALWCITNIASGTHEHTIAVVESGAATEAVTILADPDAQPDVVEQASWLVGNVAGDSAELRDYLLQAGCLPALLGILERVGRTAKLSLMRNCTWAVSNLCRGRQPPPDFDAVRVAIPVCARLIFATDDEVVGDACWALSYMSDGPNEQIQAVIDSGATRRLAELLLHTSRTVVTPALRTVGNIATGNDMQTQVLLNTGVLEHISRLLSSTHDSHRKESAWVISNITAGNQAQIELVLAHDTIMPRLIEILLVDLDTKVKKEACWALGNAISGGNHATVFRICDLPGCLDALSGALDIEHEASVQCALDAIRAVLDVDASRETGEPIYTRALENNGCSDKIDDLCANEKTSISERASRIFEEHFTRIPVKGAVTA